MSIVEAVHRGEYVAARTIWLRRARGSLRRAAYWTRHLQYEPGRTFCGIYYNRRWGGFEDPAGIQGERHICRRCPAVRGDA